MRIRVIEHYNKPTGKFLGYEIQYKPFGFWPIWRTIDGMPWLKDKRSVEHDVFFLLSIHGIISTKDEFHINAGRKMPPSADRREGTL